MKIQCFSAHGRSEFVNISFVVRSNLEHENGCPAKVLTEFFRSRYVSTLGQPELLLRPSRMVSFGSSTEATSRPEWDDFDVTGSKKGQVYLFHGP